MDVVKAFNSELSALYEVKPPISKAKMTGITKSAIKGIKFYKHIVQSVEKFIQKCRPEYKVPGLYVVDSIVRQSRHQFGAEKDVFGPRFTKNITSTFQHLFKCAEEDRSRIIRVLNLWQKNAVFPSDVIQPLLDMGHPNTSSDSAPANDESSRWKGWSQGNNEPPPENRTYAEMSTKNLEKFTKAEMTNAIEEEASRSSMFKAQMKSEKMSEENAVKFDANLLYFDYGDEEDEEEAKNDYSQMSYDIPDPHKTLAVSMAQKFLCDPEILRQLSSFSSEQAQQALKTEPEEANFPSRLSPSQQPPLPPTAYQQPCLPMEIPSEADKDDRILPQPPLPPKDLDERSLAAIMTPHRILPPITLASLNSAGVPPIQADKDERILPDPKAPPRDLDERSLAAILAPLDRGLLSQLPFPDASGGIQFPGGVILPPQPPLGDSHGRQDGDERVMFSMPGEPPLPPQDFDERTLVMPVEERSRKERSRSRSNSRNRSSRSSRKRSRSRSPRRKRSRSPRNKNRSRSKERERLREKEREKEKERERKRKGIPPVKKDCVSVCSTTIWIGHVPKSCTGADVSNVFGEFGTVTSVDMIPPRGCAFVVMDRRQDGYRALKNLKNLKLSGSLVKMAWAPGKGVKGKEYKDYWEVDLGVSYIPYKKIPESAEALDLLEDGGVIDEESLSEKLKMIRKQPETGFSLSMIPDPAAVSFNAVQAPPMVPPPLTSVNLPMLLHHHMQPQFGLHLSGLLPPQAMVMQVPMGIPPPNPMVQQLMVQQQSQSILAGQTLPLVGGVPPLVPRSVPLANALQNMKNVPLAEQAIGSPMVPAVNKGDATPTEEERGNAASPSAQKSAQPPVPTSVMSSQASQIAAQFSAMMGSNRSMMSVPPPVSTSGTPIPYPPPNVGFNFPPPGMRPQMGANSPFSFMQKPEGDGRTGMLPHMMNPRLPFHEQQSGKDPHGMNNRDTDRQSSDMDISRPGSSPMHPGKMQQEMVISTDDESSMDREYSRIEVPGPRFPSANEFSRMPMNMHRMRGPMGPMQGSRFPPMGGPFHSGMRGPGMHPGMRMEMMDMDFPGNSGPRSRVQMEHYGGRRGPDCEERDWYPRDFDGPSFERDRRYPEERIRGGWVTDEDLEPRHDMRNHENDVREDRPDARNRDEKRDQPPRRPPRKSGSGGKDLMADFHRLRHYQGDKKPIPFPSRDKGKEREKMDNDKNKNSSTDKKSDEPPKNNNDESNARRERELRKRSRWGRTLSEEREFHEQKRTEIEMKFQSYEQSAQAAQALLPEAADVSDNPAVSLDGDNQPVDSEGNGEPMDTVESSNQPVSVPVPILSVEAVNELISHPAITKLVSETIGVPTTPGASLGDFPLSKPVPESSNDGSGSIGFSKGVQEELSADLASSDLQPLSTPVELDLASSDLQPLSTPVELPVSNIVQGTAEQDSIQIDDHSEASAVSELASDHETSTVIDNSMQCKSTLVNSTVESSSNSNDISNNISNENSHDHTIKDMADISNVNKSPCISAES